MSPITAIIFAFRNRRLLKVVLIALLAAGLALGIVIASIVVTLNEALARQDECSANPTGSGTGQPMSSVPGPESSIEGIPQNYLDLYVSSAKERNLDWSIMAGIGWVETNHYANKNTSSAGAQGPMQFMPDTWAGVGIDGNGDGKKDVTDPEDAIPSSAQYLADSGAPEDYQDALQTYNGGAYRGPETAEYAQKVLDKAQEYRQSAGSGDEKIALIPGNQILAGAGNAIPSLLDFGFGSPAHAEPNGWDLVENKKLVYEDHTAYDPALQHSVSSWNKLGTVSIEEGSGVSISDGQLQPGTGGITNSSGYITLNADSFERSTQNAQNAMMVHEFGHALGLGHESGETVMQGVTTNATSNYDVPTARDKEVYYEIHGRPEPGDRGSSGQPVSRGGQGEQKAKASFPLPKDSDYEIKDNWGDAGGHHPGSHQGSDITVADGTPVLAPADGKVVMNKWTESGGWVLMIELSEDVGTARSGDRILYGHLEKKSPSANGTEVKAGDEVGKTGSTGGGSQGSKLPEGEGGHLHVGWFDPTGKRADNGTGAMNPYDLLKWLEENADGGGAASPTACPNGAPGATGSGFTPPGGEKASGTAKEVLDEANKYMGVAYQLGGMDVCVPGEMMDCTCFTLTVFKKFGTSMPDHPQQQYSYGDPVDKSDMKPADLIIFNETEPGTGGHSGIYVGDGKMIHASAFTQDVTLTDVDAVEGFRGARRLVESGGSN